MRKYITFMVGLTHVVSVLPDWSNPGIFSRSTSRTVSGELQDSSLRMSGSDARSFPVFFLIGFYSIVKDGLIVRARRGLRKVLGHSGDMGGPGMIGER